MTDIEDSYLQTLRKRQDAEWEALASQPATETAPEVSVVQRTPKLDAPTFWKNFVGATGADIGDILAKGLSFGIIKGKDLPIVGKLIEENKTPEEMLTGLEKVVRGGAELGLSFTSPLAAPLSEAGTAAGALFKGSGLVVKGLVKGATEGALIGGAQTGVDALRGEATPGSALEKIGGGAVMGGGLGALGGKLKKNAAEKAVTVGEEPAVAPPAAEAVTGAPEAAKAPPPTATAQPEAAQGPLVSVTKKTVGEAKQFLGMESKDLQIEGKDVGINFDRINTEDDVKTVLAKLTKLYKDQIDKARRGVRSREETAKAADALGMTAEDVLAIREGTAMNAEESLALRKFMVAGGTELKRLQTEYQTAPTPENFTRFMKQFAVMGAALPKHGGVRAEAGRALNIFGENVTGEAGFIEQMRSMYENVTAGTPPEKLVQMVAGLEKPEQIAQFARALAKPGASDMLMELWINSLLSGPQTHSANILSNAITAVWGPIERSVAARMGTKGAEQVVPGEALAMAYGSVQGFRDALRTAWRAAKSGQAQMGLEKVDIRAKSIAAENVGLNPEGVLGQAVDLLGEVVRLPGRALMSSDEFFKGINYRMELNAQAYRTAYSEGLEGRAFADRMAEVIADPPVAIQRQAEAYAAYQTFNQELGETGQAILRFVDSHKAFRLVLPFVRTPTNIMKYTAERTPGLNLLMRGFRDDLNTPGPRQQMAKAKLALGSMVMMTLAGLAAEGYITGGGPTNRVLKERKMETGWLPYSLHIPGTDQYIQLSRLGPVGDFMGLAADFSELSGAASSDNLLVLGLLSSVAFARTYIAKNYLLGVAGVFDAIADPQEGLKKYGDRLAGSFVPAGVAQVARTQDPTLREINGLLDIIKSRTPGFSKDLPPRRNLFGDEIVMDGKLGPDLLSPIAISHDKKDPVADEIVHQGFRISMHPDWIGGSKPKSSFSLSPDTLGAGIPLTPQEYDLFVRLAGNELKVNGLGMHDKLLELINSDNYKRQSNGPEGGKAYLVDKIIRDYRTAAELELMKRSELLRDAVNERKRARVEALRPSLNFTQ